MLGWIDLNISGEAVPGSVGRLVGNPLVGLAVVAAPGLGLDVAGIFVGFAVGGKLVGVTGVGDFVVGLLLVGAAIVG